MDVNWIEYNHKKILFSNYSGCITPDEMINILHQEQDILLQQEKKILVMANYRNSFGSPKYMDEVKKIGKETLTKKIDKTAVLGIYGVKKVLFNAYIKYSKQKNVKTFKNQEEALEWLTRN